MNDLDSEVAGAWARIEAALDRVLPESVPQLGDPADDQAIDAVQDALGLVLPPDFRASLRGRRSTPRAGFSSAR